MLQRLPLWYDVSQSTSPRFSSTASISLLAALPASPLSKASEQGSSFGLPLVRRCSLLFITEFSTFRIPILLRTAKKKKGSLHFTMALADCQSCPQLDIFRRKRGQFGAVYHNSDLANNASESRNWQHHRTEIAHDDASSSDTNVFLGNDCDIFVMLVLAFQDFVIL